MIFQGKILDHMEGIDIMYRYHNDETVGPILINIMWEVHWIKQGDKWTSCRRLDHLAFAKSGECYGGSERTKRGKERIGKEEDIKRWDIVGNYYIGLQFNVLLDVILQG